MTSVFYRPQQGIKTHAYAPLARGGHYDTCGGSFSVFQLFRFPSAGKRRESVQ